MNEVKVKEPDNSPMKIGLDEQGHLPTIKRMREKGSTWSQIAREITGGRSFRQFVALRNCTRNSDILS